MDNNTPSYPLLSKELSGFEKMKEIAGQSPAELRVKLARDLARRHLDTLRQQNADAVKTSSATPVTNTVTATSASSGTTTYTVAASSCMTPVSTAELSLGVNNFSTVPPIGCSFQAPSTSLRRKRNPSNCSKEPANIKKSKANVNNAKIGKSSQASTSNGLRNNRFAPLAEEVNSIEEMETNEETFDPNSQAQSSSQPDLMKPKPPPICVPKVTNILTLERTLDEIISADKYEIRTSKFGITRIYTDSADSFRKVVRSLTALNCEFWHHQLREDKPFKLVIRNIHSTVPREEIERCYTDKGFNVANIYCPRKPGLRGTMSDVTNDERQNLFYVNLKMSPNVTESLKIKQIGRHRVTVEKATRNKDLVQCYKCQNFGHTQNCCFIKPVCGNCAGDHPTNSKSCESHLNNQCMCANCGENHPAGFKGCKVRMELSQKLKAGVSQRNTTTSRTNESRHGQLFSMSATRDGVSYADMARNSLPNNISAAARQTVAHVPEVDRNPNRNLSTLEKAIFDINARLDQLFKLVMETIESNKAFRDLVQVLISRK